VESDPLPTIITAHRNVNRAARINSCGRSRHATVAHTMEISPGGQPLVLIAEGDKP